MKKIGILTFHRARNYGAVLQCFAMQTFLKENGFDVEVVDYRSPNIEAAYKLINLQSPKSFLCSVRGLYKAISANLVFYNFRKQYLSITNKEYHKASDFKDNFDAYVIGSDQVWSPRLNKGYDPVYWGDFDRTAVKLAYAASMGNHELFKPDEIKIIQKYSQNFKAISTREKTLQTELKSIVETPIQEVLDPSLLVDSKYYDVIAEQPCERDYIVYYQQEYNPRSRFLIENMARLMNCKIIIMAGKKEKYDVEYKYIGKDSLTVPMFLGYIKYAKFVFTSSFHGTAFSIIFKKDFYFLKNASVDRAMNLLRRLDILERGIESCDEAPYEHIDYFKVYRNLEKCREDSRVFLLMNLQ